MERTKHFQLVEHSDKSIETSIALEIHFQSVASNAISSLST